MNRILKMMKIKLNPPYTAPRDGHEFIAFYKFGAMEVSWAGWDHKAFIPTCRGMCKMDSTGCCSLITDTMLGWIEKERFEVC